MSWKDQDLEMKEVVVTSIDVHETSDGNAIVSFTVPSPGYVDIIKSEFDSSVVVESHATQLDSVQMRLEVSKDRQGQVVLALERRLSNINPTR